MRLISININVGSYSSFVEQILELGHKGSGYVCVANVHMLVQAYLDKSYAQIINDADLVTPDGVPLTWGMRLLDGIKQERVAGMDLVPDILDSVQETNTPVYFYGGTRNMMSIAIEKLPKVYPKLNVAGTYCPPFRDLNSREVIEISEEINSSGAKIVFVCLGCPKQERWMDIMKSRINAAMIGIGGALPVLLGMKKRAPRILQRCGLEWMYRLYQEPRRLYKRYGYTNSLFIYLLFKEFIRVRILRKGD